MAGLQIRADSRFLNLECQPGEIEMSTIWPGGSDQLAWSPGLVDPRRFRGGELVEAFYGPVIVWAGQLLEPDPSQDQLVATGSWRLGDNFAALGGGGGASLNPDVSIDQAISRGLGWTRPNSILNAQTPLDVSQGPVTVGALLDAFADNTGVRWGVDARRQVFAKADDTTPTYQTFPLSEGLGYALDNYASTLVCRYLDSATSTFKTITVTDSAAATAHGIREQVVDLTGRGAITSTVATSIGNSLLSLGRSVPQWTASIEVGYGEILSTGGVPVALETVTAGRLLRVHGGFELAQRLNGAMYIDVPIGRTQVADGKLTITPANVVVGNLTDAITAAMSK